MGRQRSERGLLMSEPDERTVACNGDLKNGVVTVSAVLGETSIICTYPFDEDGAEDLAVLMAALPNAIAAVTDSIQQQIEEQA